MGLWNWPQISSMDFLLILGFEKNIKELKKIEGKPLVNLEKKQLCGILDFYGYSYKINQGKYYVTIKLV